MEDGQQGYAVHPGRTLDLANGGPYGTKPDGHAEIRTDGKVPYAYIRNSYIMQKLEDFRLVPEYRQTNSQGERVPGVVYLSFSYRVIKPEG